MSRVIEPVEEEIEYLPIEEWIAKYGRPEPSLDADGVRVFGVMPNEFSKEDE